jgi:N-sulfoglucosamine sulfohydrolase
MDQGVGHILDGLKQTGHADDTLVIFLSDNGIPFPGAKTTVYDPGVQLPLIVSTPTLAKRGIVNRAMVSWVDIAPTMLDWAGVAAPEAMAGRSLLPILGAEEPNGWDKVYLSHTFHEVTMYYPMRAVRTRQYKFIWNLAHELPFPPAADLYHSATWQAVLAQKLDRLGDRPLNDYTYRPKEELYDLAKDPGELKNVAEDPAYAAVLKELREDLWAFMKRTKDPWAVRQEY